MVILISAVGSTGKTFLAQQLLEKYKIPYLSQDHLKMGLYRGIKNCGFTPLSNTEVIAEKLWPITKGIIETNIENNQQLIIEGCYILPQHVKEFNPAYLNKTIAIYFGFSANYIKENFTSKIVEYRNAVETRTYPEERSINDLINEHENFKALCESFGVKYFEIDTDYEQAMKNIYNYIEAQKCKMEEDSE